MCGTKPANALVGHLAQRPSKWGVKGLGNANAPAGNRDFLSQLPAQGVMVARCSRWIPGGVTHNSSMFNDDGLGTLTAGTLPPHKTRIAMMLGLAHGLDAKALQDWLNLINQH